MKQVIQISPDTPDYIRLFIRIWKQRKQYDLENTLTVGQLLELIIATSNNLHSEDSDGRFFNHLLRNEESVIAWDGEELVDTLFYEATENIKKRCKSSSLFGA